MKVSARLTGATAVALALLAAPALPCSAFLVTGDGRVLFGNNEDYLDPDTHVWFVPAEEGRLGVMYLGFGNGFPQGGMNEAGLAFDGFATETREMKEQDGKRPFPGNPIHEAMETCSTVDEVVALLEAVDLRPLLTNAMLFFADANGDSVIVEGDRFLRKEGDFQAITNFYQSAYDDDLAQCPRYAAAHAVLSAREETSVEVCERALAAAAQRGNTVATLYSNVFDLEARTARLYLFHDYEHAVELDLAEELAKGEHDLRLPELFEENARFEEFKAYKDLSKAERIAERRGPDPPEAVLEALQGAFDLQIGGEVHRLTTERRGGKLFALCSIFVGGEYELYPVTQTEYFAMSTSGELTFLFDTDESGAATGLALDLNGVKYPAPRVTD